jgi:hypothetical protein
MAGATDSPSQNHPRGRERYEAPVPRRAAGPVVSLIANVDVALAGVVAH